MLAGPLFLATRALFCRGQLNQAVSLTRFHSNGSESSQKTMALLDARVDAYGGVIVDPDAVCRHADPESFRSSLTASLDDWRQSGTRGVWLQLRFPSCAALVSVAADLGFAPHHAEKDYIMMTAWLPDTPCTLPANASHQVGVGMFVTHRAPDGQTYVLCVQEKNGVLKGKNVWKMPTGLVNEREDITEAAVREVLEETGLPVSFDAVIALRQSHGWAFGKSDMFFVLAMTPRVPPGTPLKDIVLNPQETEIDAVAWRTLDEFTSEAFFQGRPLFRKIMGACRRYAEGTYSGLRALKLGHGLSDREDLLMFAEAEEDVSGFDGGTPPRLKSEVWMS